MQLKQTQIHTQPARWKVPGWLLAFGIALLAAGIMFLPFLIMDRGLFFFFGDFNVQQVPFYQMIHDAIRSGNFFWSWYHRPGGQHYRLLYLLSAGQPLLLADPPLPQPRGSLSNGAAADAENGRWLLSLPISYIKRYVRKPEHRLNRRHALCLFRLCDL